MAGERGTTNLRRDPGAEAAPRDADQDRWVDSIVMRQRIRGAQADPALSRELDELFPDTLADR